MLTLFELSSQLDLKIHSLPNKNHQIRQLITDTRNIIQGFDALFFALPGRRRDGIDFIFNAYAKGIRNFILPRAPSSPLPEANIGIHEYPLTILQKIAQIHRHKFQLYVIAIAGSKGKTTLKEYLSIVLSSELNLIKNPHSFNSQIGVPLSVWQIQAEHQLGIFEAGISKSGEMSTLRNILNPELGIFTNLDETHAEGFTSEHSKLYEKLKLFHSVKTLIVNHDLVCFKKLVNYLQEHNPMLKIITWSTQNNPEAKLKIQLDNSQKLLYDGLGYSGSFQLPFHPNEPYVIEHLATILCVLDYLNLPLSLLNNLLDSLENMSNLGLTHVVGLSNCNILIPNYAHDLNSLKGSMISLFSEQNQGKNSLKKILIISDFPAMNQAKWQSLNNYLSTTQLDLCICIGLYLTEHHLNLSYPCYYYTDTYSFLANISQFELQDTRILLQGDKYFQFKKIQHFLENIPHTTHLKVNLSTLNDNLTLLQKYLHKQTKIMLMVKSDAYGSGIGRLKDYSLFSHIDYLGVAFISEGIELRKNDIALPIMVMNSDPDYYDEMLNNHLEPEIFSLNSLRKFIQLLKDKQIQNYPIHIKIDTGMHRLGFIEDDLPELINLLVENSDYLHVNSIFSHLIGSETAIFDNFTQQQAENFIVLSQKILNILPYRPLLHIANTQAILRHPNLQMDMVRIGIGLYGINMSMQNFALKNALSFVSSIAQIKNIRRHESIGYGRQGKLDHDARVATLRLGYADGYPRSLGNGIGKVFLHGQLAPTIGNICMDMTMIDITHIPQAQENDMVEIFGDKLSIIQLANWAKTIPYELLTQISSRVQRRYII